MQIASRAEISALSLQDHAMKAQLEKSLRSFSRARELAETVSESLVADINSYATLLANANSAVQSAIDAIRAASRACKDYRVLRTAKNKLKNARKILPDPPPPGTTREALERIIKHANKAKGLAATASSLAESNIRNHVEYDYYDDDSFTIWDLFNESGTSYSYGRSRRRRSSSSWGGGGSGFSLGGSSRSSGGGSRSSRSSFGGGSRSSRSSFGSGTRSSRSKF